MAASTGCIPSPPSPAHPNGWNGRLLLRECPDLPAFEVAWDHCADTGVWMGLPGMIKGHSQASSNGSFDRSHRVAMQTIIKQRVLFGYLALVVF